MLKLAKIHTFILFNAGNQHQIFLARAFNRTFIILVFHFFSLLQSFALFSNTPYQFGNLDINDGLSQNLISAIHQDSDGFIWIGTKDGLNRYDGYSFTIFKHDPFNPASVSGNHINALHTDKQGRLWIGTFSKGLNLFNRTTGKFTRFVHDPENHNTISSNNITTITDDIEGNLWVGTSQGIINRITLPGVNNTIDSQNIEITRFINNPDYKILADQTNISSLFVDDSNFLWIGTSKSIFKLNTRQSIPEIIEIPVSVIDDPRQKFHREYHDREGGIIIFQDQRKETWMLSRLGLFKFDTKTDSFQQILADYSINHAENTSYNALAAISFQNKEREEFWLSTENALFIYYPETGTHKNISEEDPQVTNLPGGQIIELLKDKAGSLWIGSNGFGIALYDPYKLKFNYPKNTETLENNTIFTSRNLSIRTFHETEDNTLWIGANEGFFKVNRATSEMRQIHLKSSANYQMVVYSIDQDENGMLWLASSAGLFQFNPDNDVYTVFPAWHREDPLITEPSIENDDPRTAKIKVDGENIWVLTPYSLALFNNETGEFDHLRYNSDQLNVYRENYFPNFLQVEPKEFWVGSQYGLQYIDFETKNIITYQNDPSNPKSLPFDNVRAILPDPYFPEKYLWLATGGGGIARFDKSEEHFTTFSEKDGLANNMVYGMLADDEGNLWLSTNKGISEFDVKQQTFSNFTVSDGLQSNEFNSGAFFKNQAGEMFFGGIKGYNTFFPSQIKAKDFSAPIVFTRFNVLGANNSELNNEFLSIFQQNYIELNHNQNDFYVEFSSLDYASPEKNFFEYSMGKDDPYWIPLGNKNNITFTNLKPATYHLNIRGTNNDGQWSNSTAELTIKIKRPWYTTNLAIAGYFILLVVLVLSIRQYEVIRYRMRNQIRIAAIEASKLKDLDSMKSKFFSNISHELRTPLTLIKGPVEQLLEQIEDTAHRKLLSNMKLNTERLLELINQLLDLSKLESGQYKLRVARGDIAPYMKGFVLSFASMAKQKNITLKFFESSSVRKPWLKENFYFDIDVIEKILTNLISNAFKFTPEGGKITVTICQRTLKNKNTCFEIIVKDTGIGIAKEHLPFIYNRFYQVDDSLQRKYEGTGIGLAYVKELLNAHNSKISVMSKPGAGTVFRLRFPLGKYVYTEEQIIETDHAEAPKITDKIENTSSANVGTKPIKGRSSVNNQNPLILIIEDYQDVRDYIIHSLGTNYTFSEAENGEEGLTKAFNIIPDLIICDVMMPGMNGFDVCQKIKTNDKTSHVPVILLTARVDKNDILYGLETGADDYITKPFNAKELQARTKNIIESRRLLRGKFEKNTIVKPAEISVTPRDRAFMENLLAIAEQNISSENFTVEDFSNAVGMSPSQLHRKLKAVINQSAIQFLRSVKMHRAKELLEKDAGNIAEISYMVGFGDPGYFTRTFKSFFGKLPSEIKQS